MLDSKTALIVIDMQNGVLGLLVAHLVSETVQPTATLADAFHRRRLPVVIVNVTGMAPGRTDEPQVDFNPPTNWADLIDELGAQQDDHTVTKERWGAFMEPHCTTTCRVKTSPRSSSSALRPVSALSPRPAPHEHGYHVVLATDAMTDTDPDAHRHSIEKIFPQLGETATTDELVARLAG